MLGPRSALSRSFHVSQSRPRQTFIVKPRSSRVCGVPLGSIVSSPRCSDPLDIFTRLHRWVAIYSVKNRRRLGPASILGRNLVAKLQMFVRDPAPTEVFYWNSPEIFFQVSVVFPFRKPTRYQKSCSHVDGAAERRMDSPSSDPVKTQSPHIPEPIR